MTGLFSTKSQNMAFVWANFVKKCAKKEAKLRLSSVFAVGSGPQF